MLNQILEKLLVEARQSDLKTAVEQAITTSSQKVDDCWTVFKLALLDTQTRILALNSLQKLTAHVLISGRGSGDETLKEEWVGLAQVPTINQDFPFLNTSNLSFSLIDEMVLCVYQIAIKQENPEVQLQVLKLFLTVVTAEHLQLHSLSLLLIIKVCFVIHAQSTPKSTNQVTAKVILVNKASLTQMINLIFSRMERFASLYFPDSQKDDKDFKDEKKLVLQSSDQDICQSSAEADPNEAVVEKVEPAASPDVPAADDHEKKDQLQRLKQDVQAVLDMLCRYGIVSDNGEVSPTSSFVAPEVILGDELSPNCIIDRTLALELLLSVLNNVGPVFRHEDVFFQVVKNHLCLVVSKNSVTTNPVLFELSLSIYLLIIRFFRHKLKLEVEMQFVMYLQILEMGNSTYKQKSQILQGLLIICETPQTLVDIYLNYDCEFEMSSIYEKIVSVCSRISQGRIEANPQSKSSASTLTALAFGDTKQLLAKQQERRLHLRSLCVLTAIIKSLVHWSSESSQTTSSEPVKKDEHLTANPIVVGKNPLDSITVDHAVFSPDTNTEHVDNDQAEHVASRKQSFKKALKLFNANPKKGMKAFVTGGFVEEKPEPIALFLLNTPELSKASIGEYIGDGSQFNIRVMRAFIDSIDFSGMDFVQALRHFLQAFRLPGEAQKIDRMMEKFADRFCELNPTVFAKADTAYTLAFSVIMLNTDQHSSQIKHRMDKAAFIKNNRGINDDGDLPDEFLGAIFDEIHQNEIIMQDDSSIVKMTMGWGAGEANERKRLEIYKKEVSMIQKKTQLLMTGGTRVASPFKVAANRDLARSMFSTCAWALMAALSISFEADPDAGEPTDSREPNVADLCLSGFAGAIRIASLFRLETERDAFVTCLAKLTYLSHFYDIRAKNIKAITTLIQIASTLGESLETGWIEIIKSLSLLEKMQMAVLRGETGDAPRHLTESTEEKKDHAPHHVSKTLEKYVEQVQSQTSLIVIDRIFTTSVQLSAHAIIHFFKAVCQVSLEEVGMTSTGELMPSYGPPRMYLLQKIVEIAHYNMHRIRFEWTQIWRILQPHFNRVACHPSQAVANFAVDSLRQLGVKFLDREELGQFSAQHEFLKSFEYIIKNNQSPAIREMILNSLSQMITARASRIRSGWKSIFVTFVRAAQADEKMAQSSFQNIQAIFRKHFEDVVAAGGFVDLVACLAEYALLPGNGPTHDELVMSSIQMIQSCTKSLMERADDEATGKRKPTPSVSLSTKSTTNVSLNQPQVHIPRINNLPQQPYLLANGCISEEHFYLSWFPILTAFSRVVTESEGVLVRTHTMEILFETFKSCGQLFDAQYWKTINRNIVTPIFEDLNDPETGGLRESNSAVIIHGLRLLVQLVTTHFESFIKLSQGGETSTLDFIHSCIDRMVDMMINPDEKLASTGQTCFNQFLLLNATKFDELSWDWVSAKIAQVCRTTLPAELIRCQDPKSYDSNCPAEIMTAALTATEHLSVLSLDSLDFAKTVIKCVIHLELLNTVKEFALVTTNGTPIIASMPKQSRSRVLLCMYNSYVVARLFNSLTTIRHAIYKRGWVAQLPNLVKQETTSLSSYLSLLFSVCSSTSEIDLLERLSFEVLDLFKRFNDLLADPIKSQRDISSWTPIVVNVLKELVEYDALLKQKGPLRTQIPQLYQYTVRMTTVDKPDLRSSIIEFLERVGKHFFTV